MTTLRHYDRLSRQSVPSWNLIVRTPHRGESHEAFQCLCGAALPRSDRVGRFLRPRRPHYFLHRQRLVSGQQRRRLSWATPAGNSYFRATLWKLNPAGEVRFCVGRRCSQASSAAARRPSGPWRFFFCKKTVESGVDAFLGQ